MTAPTPYEPPDGHIICLRKDVPDGWEYRFDCDGTYWYPSNAASATPAMVVEARPVRQSDPPKWLRTGGTMCISMTWTGDRTGDDGHMYGVTTVGEMRDRTDLNQWEYADSDGYWNVMATASDGWWDEIAFRDESFPVIVRRVE